jgi:transposase
VLICGLGEARTKEESVCRDHVGRIVNDQNQDTRRMSKDYERLPESGEAFIYVAMSRLMARRLARS